MIIIYPTSNVDVSLFNFCFVILLDWSQYYQICCQHNSVAVKVGEIPGLVEKRSQHFLMFDIVSKIAKPPLTPTPHKCYCQYLIYGMPSVKIMLRETLAVLRKKGESQVMRLISDGQKPYHRRELAFPFPRKSDQENGKQKIWSLT